MDIELLTWLRGGEYRIKVLEVLTHNSFLLPSEIADRLDIHRSSISRILSDLKAKNLIKAIKSNSRTIAYSITEPGATAYKDLVKNEKQH